MTSLDKMLKTNRKELRRRYQRFRRPGVIALTAALFISLVMFIAHLAEGKFEHSLQPGDIADRDYVIPETFEMVDTASTEREKTLVRQQVEPVMKVDPDRTAECIRDIKAFYFDVDRLKTGRTIVREPPEWWTAGVRAGIYPDLHWDAEVLGILMDDAARGSLRNETVGALQDVLSEGVSTGLLDQSMRELGSRFEAAFQNSTVTSGSATPAEMERLAEKITWFFLQPNSFVDPVETENRRREAADEVVPVMKTLQEDQVYIRKGQIVTVENIEVHREVLQRTPPVIGGSLVRPGAFLASLVVLLGVFIAYVYRLHPEFVAKSRYIPLVFSVLSLNLAIYHLVVVWLSGTQPTGYQHIQAGVLLTFPALVTTFCILLFLNYEICLLASLVLIYILSALYSLEAPFVLYFLLLTMATATLLRKVRTGGEVLKRVHWILLTSMTFTLLLFMVFNESPQAVLWSLMWCAFLTALSVVIYIGGFRPLLQEMFRITTTEKLLELGNLNQPLLKRLQIEAIGTYHHSLVMGTIGEAAAERIGADGVLVRVAALYHDIGKIRRPMFFTENQQDRNPHDEIPASMSKLILEGHVRDGITMAREAGLPEEVIDFIPSHHGTSLMFSFFHKALKDAKIERERPAEDFDYRYEFPRPMSRETGILHLADACESAVRSLDDPSPEKVESLVSRIIRAKVQDGQLDNCPLTLYEIAAVRDEFIRALAGAHHHRVKYPDPEELEKLKK